MAKNEKLLSNEVKLYWVDGNTTMKAPLPSKTDCHFLHNSEEMTAALSDCHDGFSGHILQSGHILGMYVRITLHEIRGLCSTKCSSKSLPKLPYFMYLSENPYA